MRCSELVTTNAPEGFEVTTSGDGHLVINRRRVGPRWFMWAFYVVGGGWLLGWIFAGVFLSYHALAARNLPLWLAALWWVCGIVVGRYVFGEAWRRLRSVTSYTFSENDLLIENILLIRRTRRKVDRGTVQAVRQVYDGGAVDDLVTHSWALLVESPGKLTLMAHEEFETSAWLGRLVSQWAGVSYESSERRNHDAGPCQKAGDGG